VLLVLTHPAELGVEAGYISKPKECRECLDWSNRLLCMDFILKRSALEVKRKGD
jgi:hypothetical protein